MIVEAIFQLVIGFVNAITAFLPDWQPIELTDSVGPLITQADRVFSLLAWLNFYLPVTEAVSATGLLITLHTAALLSQAIVWLLSKLHLTGGGSD